MTVNYREIMSNTTSKKIYLIISSVFVIAVMFIGTNQHFQDDTTIQEFPPMGFGVESTSVSPPTETTRTGIPFLVSYPMVKAPESYHQVNIDDYEWISRTIKKGEAPANEDEIREFFKIISDDVYNFEVKFNNGDVHYYSIEFNEVPLSSDVHYVKAYRLFDDVPEQFETVNVEHDPWLKQAIEKPFRWIKIDESSAKKLNELTADGNFDFRIAGELEQGEYFNIRYTGPGMTVQTAGDEPQ